MYFVILLFKFLSGTLKLWLVSSDAKYFMGQNPNYFKILKENLNQCPNFFSHIIELVYL